MMNSLIMPSQFSYNSSQIVETQKINYTISKFYGESMCGGAYLKKDDYYNYYIINNKPLKMELLELFANEVYFDEEDKLAEKEEMKELLIEKKDNFYSYYV